jgi:hypothetical protein
VTPESGGLASVVPVEIPEKERTAIEKNQIKILLNHIIPSSLLFTANILERSSDVKRKIVVKIAGFGSKFLQESKLPLKFKHV